MLAFYKLCLCWEWVFWSFSLDHVRPVLPTRDGRINICLRFAVLNQDDLDNCHTALNFLFFLVSDHINMWPVNQRIAKINRQWGQCMSQTRLTWAAWTESLKQVSPSVKGHTCLFEDCDMLWASNISVADILYASGVNPVLDLLFEGVITGAEWS